MASDDQQVQTVSPTFVGCLEDSHWPASSKFSDVAAMIEDAERMFRVEISVADHRNCQGGDFDLCWCKRDPAAAERQLAHVERLEAGLAALVDLQAKVTRSRQQAKDADDHVALLLAHPEADVLVD